MLIKPKLDRLNMPKHIAFTVDGVTDWADDHKKPLDEVYKKAFERINELVEWQIKYKLPLMTINLLPSKVSKSDYFSDMMDALVEFFEQLSHNTTIFENKIKVSILGKWYNLPGRVIDSIKKVIDETKDYDHFFFNLCINYDGKEEIVDSCKLISRRIFANKMDVETIDEEAIKDNLYSSYFLPPDLIIKTGYDHRLSGFLLWDSTEAVIHFTDLSWIEYDEDDLLHSFKYYVENK